MRSVFSGVWSGALKAVERRRPGRSDPLLAHGLRIVDSIEQPTFL